MLSGEVGAALRTVRRRGDRSSPSLSCRWIFPVSPCGSSEEICGLYEFSKRHPRGKRIHDLYGSYPFEMKDSPRSVSCLARWLRSAEGLVQMS